VDWFGYIKCNFILVLTILRTAILVAKMWQWLVGIKLHSHNQVHLCLLKKRKHYFYVTELTYTVFLQQLCLPDNCLVNFPHLPYLYKILPICKRWFGLLQVCTPTRNSAVLNGTPSTEIKQESIFFNSDKGLRILFHLVQISAFHYHGVSKHICNELLVDCAETLKYDSEVSTCLCFI
jgi:hypothetical protein